MFCAKCGNRVNDNDKFCQRCGTPIEIINDAIPINISQLEYKSNSKKKMIIVFSFVLLIVITISVYFLFINININIDNDEDNMKDYEIPIYLYFKGINNGDIDTVKKAFHGKHLNGYMPDTFDEEHMQDIVDEIEDDYGTNYKITYDIEDVRASEESAINQLSPWGFTDPLDVDITVKIKTDNRTEEFFATLVLVKFDEDYDILYVEDGGFVYLWQEVLTNIL